MTAAPAFWKIIAALLFAVVSRMLWIKGYRSMFKR
jgi:hypothetical protein